MLTIFGKKKKGEKPSETTEVETAPERVPSKSQSSNQEPNPSSAQTSSPAQSATPTTPVGSPAPPAASNRSPFASEFESEETSLNKLLQSLLQDLPPSALGRDPGSASSLPASTPDYVPLRSTPQSRAMVIEPGEKVEDHEEEEEDFELPQRRAPAPPPAKIVKPPEPPPKVEIKPPPAPPKREEPAVKVETKPPPIPQKREEPEKVVKVEKLEKPEKPEKPSKETVSRKDARGAQGLDHIFQLTQGNLETPGLVIINGEPGSGKTTLCSGLTGNYLKLGNPCLYVTYDEAPSTLRDKMKKLGVNPEESESSFRLVIVDAYSGQNDSFSMEPYYVEKPFEFDSIQVTVVRNSEFFTGEKIRVVFDSVDLLASKMPVKDFVKGLSQMVSKLKENGATVILTAGLSKLSKDLAGSLEDLADCIIDLSEDESDSKGRELKIRRLNHSSSKLEPETLELDSSKGLVFV